MDIRKELYKEKMQQLEEEMTPFGFINDGGGDDFQIDADGTLWKDADSDNPGGMFSW